MAASNPPDRTQEQSIKARKHQLFGADDDQARSGPRPTFAELLRVTPADPLSPLTKGILWTVGALVILLLLAAFATVATRTRARPRPRPRPAETVSLGHSQPRIDCAVGVARSTWDQPFRKVSEPILRRAGSVNSLS